MLKLNTNTVVNQMTHMHNAMNSSVSVSQSTIDKLESYSYLLN